MLLVWLSLCICRVGAETPLKKIVLIGDSLTEGYGVSREQAYPALIQKRAEKDGLHWLVINAGISGSTAASAKSRVEWQLKQKPDLIMIALGANDGLRGTDIKNIESNLSAALEVTAKSGVKIILAGVYLPPNYGADYTRRFAAIYPRLAAKYHTALIPFLLENVGGQQNLNQSDGIHPNAKGHERIVNTVYPAIVKLL